MLKLRSARQNSLHDDIIFIADFTVFKKNIAEDEETDAMRQVIVPLPPETGFHFRLKAFNLRPAPEPNYSEYVHLDATTKGKPVATLFKNC